MTGWWLTLPCEKYDFVSWDDEIPNWMESHKIHVPNHQAVIVISPIHQPDRYWTNNCTNLAWTAQKRAPKISHGGSPKSSIGLTFFWIVPWKTPPIINQQGCRAAAAAVSASPDSLSIARISEVVKFTGAWAAAAAVRSLARPGSFSGNHGRRKVMAVVAMAICLCQWPFQETIFLEVPTI